MSKGKEFEEKFLRLFEGVTQVFRSGEISAAMDLKAQISLESILYKEKIIVQLKNLTLEHYADNKFKNSRTNIINGLDIILVQIQNLKKQLSEMVSGADKRIKFDQEKFAEGYTLVDREIKQLLQQDS